MIFNIGTSPKPLSTVQNSTKKCKLHVRQCVVSGQRYIKNPWTPTVAVWVQL